MTLRVGVIGTGMIGQDHIRRVTQVVSGAEVVAVTDANERMVAKEVASRLPDATVHPSGQDLIADERVDAVVVCSWGPTHEEYVLACRRGRQAGVLREAARHHPGGLLAHHRRRGRGGQRLVRSGFMRRYDEAYRAMKDVVDAGQVGAPLLVLLGASQPRRSRSTTPTTWRSWTPRSTTSTPSGGCSARSSAAPCCRGKNSLAAVTCRTRC